MLVISSGEFRQKQKEYLDRVDKGEELIVQRGKKKSYKILPVEKDDTLMSKEDFFAMIDKALKEVDEGKVTRVKNKEEMIKHLNSL